MEPPLHDNDNGLCQVGEHRDAIRPSFVHEDASEPPRDPKGEVAEHELPVRNREGRNPSHPRANLISHRDAHSNIDARQRTKQKEVKPEAPTNQQDPQRSAHGSDCCKARSMHGAAMMSNFSGCGVL
eukprot:CAMPEP_0177255242 /NCGR_PEP_ID=MMETSP0367-20130122/56238_1 /TAXON_ID=447022 ORGANISM="Scrippsiella hangoei-like, Strain SHHI-4" /NCGR_SAMPLE_ID=MMETSP0367 /ASSEMBLY_ACC=CAM_ASM_000362 /LENGTH=126 /DNA_ID=CAMNT_0018708915 /DNA_START=102 /DNA_END=479 /DNA_ORIENTATION=-